MPEVWIVCGSRTIANRRWVWEVCGRHILPIDAHGDKVTVMHGGARGVDRDADSFAKKIGCRITVELPDYATYGPKRAPIMRDLKMLERLRKARELGWTANVLALWDGTSPGTNFMIESARALHFDPIIERFREETPNDHDPEGPGGAPSTDRQHAGQRRSVRKSVRKKSRGQPGNGPVGKHRATADD